MSYKYRVFFGSPDNRPNEPPQHQLWKKVDTWNIAPLFASAETDMPDVENDIKVAYRLFSAIKKHRRLAVYIGLENDGVDIYLIHGFERLRASRQKFPVKIELGTMKDFSTLVDFTAWDVLFRNAVAIPDGGFIFNMEIKGHIETEEY